MGRIPCFKALGLVAGALFTVLIAGAATPSGGDTVVAEVNGVKLTITDLETKYSTALFQAHTNYYATQRKLVDDLIDDFLLKQQAAKEGLTVDQLLDRHVNHAIAKDPSEETLRVYYEGVDTNEPYETVRDKILDALHQRRIAKAKAAYLQSLRQQANVIVRLNPPRMTIPVNDTVVRGPSEARVTVVEYADYECPYCQQIQPAVARLQTEFRGRVAFAYKDFPLSMHPNAQKAAEASRCAQKQGKYWEYHDLLTSTKELDPNALKADARKLSLDAAAFDKCLDNAETAPMVKAYQAEAQALGLQGTPTFFINGRFISGTLTYERLRDVITEELAGTDGQAATPAVNEALKGKGQPK